MSLLQREHCQLRPAQDPTCGEDLPVIHRTNEHVVTSLLNLKIIVHREIRRLEEDTFLLDPIKKASD